MTTLKTDSLLFEEKELYVPSLNEIKTVLSVELKNNFKDVAVDIVECPNLKEAPFHLAERGLSGSPKLVEIGGVPYLLPLVDQTKLYDLKEICQKANATGTNTQFAIGAGAGPFPLVHTNCEGIYNLKINNDGTSDGSNSHLVRIDPNSNNEDYIQEKIPCDECRLALLGNIFLSEGKVGTVLRVHCKTRIGSDNFITSVRNAITNHFTGKTIGMGGVFLIKNGTIKQHVMRNFSKKPLNSTDDLNNWLKFYEMPTPLIAVGTLITDEIGLDLRLEHFHSFSTHGSGGHYHYDTTPETIEYEGYFNVGEKIVRVDKPIITHHLGRN